MPESDLKTFYYYFRPIAIISKFLGAFPIQNVTKKRPEELFFRRLSFSCLYSSLIFISSVSAVWYFSGFSFYLASKSYLAVMYIILARSCLSFIFCASYSHKLPKLIQLLDAFDKKIFMMSYESRTYRTSLIYRTILPATFGFLFIGAVFIESSLLILSLIPQGTKEDNGCLDGDESASAIFGFLNTWQILPLLNYVYFASTIRINFEVITKTMKKKGYATDYYKMIKENNDNSSVSAAFDEKDMLKTLQNLRYVHGMLSKSVFELGNCYGNFMAVDHLCVTVMIVANLATFILMNGSFNQIHLLALTVINGLMVLTAIGVSDQIKESAVAVLDILQGISFSEVSPACQSEIQTFIMQIAARPIAVSAGGYFVIDKSQIGAVLSAVATYLIVCIQFFNSTEMMAGSHV